MRRGNRDSYGQLLQCKVTIRPGLFSLHHLEQSLQVFLGALQRQGRAFVFFRRLFGSSGQRLRTGQPQPRDRVDHDRAAQRQQQVRLLSPIQKQQPDQSAEKDQQEQPDQHPRLQENRFITGRTALSELAREIREAAQNEIEIDRSLRNRQLGTDEIPPRIIGRGEIGDFVFRAPQKIGCKVERAKEKRQKV